LGHVERNECPGANWHAWAVEGAQVFVKKNLGKWGDEIKILTMLHPNPIFEENGSSSKGSTLTLHCSIELSFSASLLQCILNSKSKNLTGSKDSSKDPKKTQIPLPQPLPRLFRTQVAILVKQKM
jgi:hypothetical protein